MIDLPAGTAANDVLIASIGVRPATAAITAPSGWTLVRRVDNNSTNPLSLAVFRKVAGSEPASYAFGVSGALVAVGGIQAFVNVDTANPIDVEAGQATPEALSHATPSVTTTVLNSLVVTSHTFATSSGWSPPTGMTEGFESQSEPQTSGAGMSIEGNYVLQGANAATGAKSAAAGVSADFGATHVLALRPGAGTTPLTIVKPAGTAANDVLIAAIGIRPGTATVSAPSGWTLVRRVDNSTDNSNSLAVYRRSAGSSEPASYSFDLGGTGVIAAAGIQAFSGVDTATPIDVEAGQGTSGSLSHATPSITTTVANAMLVSAHTFASSSTWTPPTGMTEAFDTQYQPIHAGGGQATEGNYVLQPAAGASGAKTATAAASSDFGATHLLALRPAPPAAAQLYFIHTDHLNTPRLVANAAGATVWRWDQQEPFGVNVADENPSGLGAFEFPLRFPGQYADKETNLHYNYFRDYDSGVGRYVQSDPIGLDGGLNTYSYVLANPLRFADARGLDHPGMGPYGSYWSGNYSVYPYSGPVDPSVGLQVECISLCIGARSGTPPPKIIVTGGTEPRPRSPTSLHPHGQAVDFGAINNPTLTPKAGMKGAVLDCACDCGFTHGGWETDWSPTSRDHYHFQNGAGAQVPKLNCNVCRP